MNGLIIGYYNFKKEEKGSVAASFPNDSKRGEIGSPNYVCARRPSSGA